MEQQNCRDMKRLKRIIINHLLELHDTSETSSERRRIGKIEQALDKFYGKRLHVEAYQLEDCVFEGLFDDYIAMLKHIVSDIQYNLNNKFYRKPIEDVMFSAVSVAVCRGAVSSAFRSGNRQLRPLTPPNSDFCPPHYRVSSSQLRGISNTLYRDLDLLGKLNPLLITTHVSYADMEEGLKTRAQERREYRVKVREEEYRRFEESFVKTPQIPNPYEGLSADVALYIRQTLGNDPFAHELLSILPIKQTVSSHELVPTKEEVVEVMIENIPFMQQVIIHPSKEETQ